MSSDSVKTRAIIQEANEWLVRMMEPGGSAEDEAGFAAWLRQSPVHVREYLRAEAVFAAMAGVDAEKRIDVGALIAADEGNVVALGRLATADGVREATASGGEGWSKAPLRTGELDQQLSAGDPALGPRRRASGTERKARRWLLQHERSPRLWASAASIILVIAAAALYVQTVAPEVYTTARGEQRRLVLEEGSVVDMNTETELAVFMDDGTRRLELIRGEALFSVAKDPGRPFVVVTDSALIEAVGTAFNVRSFSEDVTVTVVEGIVDVASRGSRPQGGDGERVDEEGAAAPARGVLEPVRLKVGQQAKIESRSGQVAIVDTIVEKAIAWQERRLIFENQPLSEVVAEFNRYNRRQLVIEDASLANERISAVFDVDQPEALVRFLTQNTPIEVVDESDARLVLRAGQ